MGSANTSPAELDRRGSRARAGATVQDPTASSFSVYHASHHLAEVRVTPEDAGEAAAIAGACASMCPILAVIDGSSWLRGSGFGAVGTRSARRCARISARRCAPRCQTSVEIDAPVDQGPGDPARPDGPATACPSSRRGPMGAVVRDGGAGAARKRRRR